MISSRMWILVIASVCVLTQGSVSMATIIPSFNNFNTAGSYEDWTKSGVATKETVNVYGGTGEAVNIRGKGGYPTYLYKDFLSDPAYTTVELSFWMYEYSASGNDQTLNVALQDSTGVGATGVNMRVKMVNGVRSLNYFYNIDNPAAPGTPLLQEGTICAVVLNQYAKLVITASADTDTFTVSYNGVTYDNNGAGFGFYQTLNRISKVQFSNTNGSAIVSRTTIDDVSIKVPEPATMALLSIGAVLLGRKRIV